MKQTSHEIHGISKSALDLLHRAPLLYKIRYIDGIKDEPTAAMIFGRLLHLIVFEPHKVNLQYMFFPSSVKRTNKAGKALYAEYVEECARTKRELLTTADFTRANAMRNSIMTNKHVVKIMEHPTGKAETKLKWINTCSEGVETLCQGRVDFEAAGGGIVLELKSCVDARPDKFRYSVFDRRYDVQAAFYKDGILAERGIHCDVFLTIAVETTAPYLCSLIQYEAETINTGRFAYQEDLFIYNTCKNTNYWPGYQQAIQDVGLTKYQSAARSQTRKGL